MRAAVAIVPRQLDIIADTALAADPRLAITSRPMPLGSSTVAMPSGSSTVDPRIAAIERKRIAAGIGNEPFARAAGISFWTWRRLRRGENVPTDATLTKLEAAFDAPKGKKPRNVIAGFHRLVTSLVADAVGEPRAAVFAADMTRQRPQDPAWLKAARIQMMATYITAVELEVGNAELGRAIGQSRQAVQKARNKIEDLRDDAAIDAALVAVTAMVALT